MKLVCSLIDIARLDICARLNKTSKSKATDNDHDESVFEQIMDTVREHPFYGYRRVTAVINKGEIDRTNSKRVYCILTSEQLPLIPAPKKPMRTQNKKNEPNSFT